MTLHFRAEHFDDKGFCIIFLNITLFLQVRRTYDYNKFGTSMF